MDKNPADTDSPALKLMMVIVQPHDADLVVDDLLRNDYRVTRISSTGGFLRQDSVTLLVVVEESQTDEVLRIITFCCHPHAELESANAGITKRRATVFVLGVEKLVGI